MTRPPTAAPAQRVCPHCARIAHTDDRRCPFCRRAYNRKLIPKIALMLLVFAAVVLGGVGAMLAAVGDRLENELDTRVDTVQRDLDRSVDRLGNEVRSELDRRLPAQP